MFINRIFDVDIEEFIKQWDKDKSDLATTVYSFRESTVGNINNIGDVDNRLAPVITKNNSIFLKAVEVGVVDLVKIIANDLNYITFSSCQGHVGYYNEKSELISFSKREVSIVPRNNVEREDVVNLFTKVAIITNKQLNNKNVYISVKTEKLEEINRIKNYFRNWYNISIVFESNYDDEQRYFLDLELAYCIYILELKKISNLY